MYNLFHFLVFCGPKKQIQPAMGTSFLGAPNYIKPEPAPDGMWANLIQFYLEKKSYTTKKSTLNIVFASCCAFLIPITSKISFKNSRTKTLKHVQVSVSKCPWKTCHHLIVLYTYCRSELQICSRRKCVPVENVRNKKTKTGKQCW